jgi:hypothetical protein
MNPKWCDAQYFANAKKFRPVANFATVMATGVKIPQNKGFWDSIGAGKA